MKIKFKPIDLLKDKETTIDFRRDAFVASFGHDKDFYGADGNGPHHYFRSLEKKISLSPPMAYHVWLGDSIIGQLELDYFNNDKKVGYVNLYYLSCDYRGRGYSKYLDEFAIKFFQDLGVEFIKLSVSPTNIRAIKFYQKHGWIDCGDRFSEEELARKKVSQVRILKRQI